MARSLTPLRSAISATEKPRFRRLTILASRSALSCRAALRAAAERSRRRAGGAGSTGSDKGRSPVGRWRTNIEHRCGLGKKLSVFLGLGRQAGERAALSVESAVAPPHSTEHWLRPLVAEPRQVRRAPKPEAVSAALRDIRGYQWHMHILSAAKAPKREICMCHRIRRIPGRFIERCEGRVCAEAFCPEELRAILVALLEAGYANQRAWRGLFVLCAVRDEE